MLRHYKNVILLIEANVKDDYKKVNGGPFQVDFQFSCYISFVSSVTHSIMPLRQDSNRNQCELFLSLISTYPTVIKK